MSDLEWKSILNPDQLEAVWRIQKALGRIGALHNDINNLMRETGLVPVIAQRLPGSWPGVRLYDAGRLSGDLQNLLMQHEIREETIARVSGGKGGAA